MVNELPRISAACERVNKQIGYRVEWALLQQRRRLYRFMAEQLCRAQLRQRACTRREDCIAAMALIALATGAALAWCYR